MDVSGSTGILIIKNPDIPSTDVNMLAFFQMEIQFGKSVVPCNEWKPVSWITCKISLNAKRLFLEDLLWRLAKNRTKNILHFTCLLPNSHQRSTKKHETTTKKTPNRKNKKNSRHVAPIIVFRAPPTVTGARPPPPLARITQPHWGGFFSEKISTLDFNHGGRDTWMSCWKLGSMVNGSNGLYISYFTYL